MANAMYDPGREGFAVGEIDFDTAVFKWLCRNDFPALIDAAADLALLVEESVAWQ